MFLPRFRMRDTKCATFAVHTDHCPSPGLRSALRSSCDHTCKPVRSQTCFYPQSGKPVRSQTCFYPGIGCVTKCCCIRGGATWSLPVARPAIRTVIRTAIIHANRCGKIHECTPKSDARHPPAAHAMLCNIRGQAHIVHMLGAANPLCKKNATD